MLTSTHFYALPRPPDPRKRPDCSGEPDNVAPSPLPLREQSLAGDQHILQDGCSASGSGVGSTVGLESRSLSGSEVELESR